MWQVQQPPSPTYRPTGAPRLTARRGGELAGRSGHGDGRGHAGVNARRRSSARPPQLSPRPRPKWRRQRRLRCAGRPGAFVYFGQRVSPSYIICCWDSLTQCLVTHGHEWYQVSSTKKKGATVVSIQHVGATKVNRKQHLRSNAIHFRVPTPPRSSMFSRAAELLHVVGFLFTYTISLAFSQQHQAGSCLTCPSCPAYSACLCRPLPVLTAHRR